MASQGIEQVNQDDTAMDDVERDLMSGEEEVEIPQVDPGAEPAIQPDPAKASGQAHRPASDNVSNVSGSVRGSGD